MIRTEIIVKDAQTLALIIQATDNGSFTPTRSNNPATITTPTKAIAKGYTTKADEYTHF